VLLVLLREAEMAKTVFCQWCAGEPGDHHPECPFGRAERAEQRIAGLERDRDEASPVLEAARAQTERHTATGVKAHLALLIVSGHSCQCGLCMAVRAYDAARAAAKEAE